LSNPQSNPNLTKKATKLLQHNLALIIKFIYNMIWINFKQFTMIHDYKIFPITFQTLINWIIDKIEKKKSEIIKIYIIILKSYHINNNLKIDILNDSKIQHMLHELFHIQDKKSIRERWEIMKDILFTIIIILQNDYDNINLHIIFYIIFIIFLRSFKFIWEIWNSKILSLIYISRNSIQFMI
jgi:hypothetical protein